MQNFIIIAIGAVAAIAGVFFLTRGDVPMDDPVVVVDDMSNDAMAPSDMDASMDADMTTDAGVLVGGVAMLPTLDIVDNAVKAPNVTTLVAAVGAAGLVDTLKGPGPFTVFAPTNDAFAALPAGTVDSLLLPANLADLQAILTYHVVAGTYTSADITDGMVLTTVNGADLTFDVAADGAVSINGNAMVETANVISSNGVTHVIDGVLLPPAVE